MHKTAILLLAFMSGLVGCVAPSKVMINPDGRQVRCGAWGFGLIGMPVAYASYSDCVKTYEAQSFVDLRDFEKGEGPKVTPILGTSTPAAARPVWDTGTVWVDQLSGARSDTLRQEVIGKDLVGGMTAYIVDMGERTLVLSEDLNTVQIRSKSTVIESHTPPLENYRWPLTLGKTWKTTGVVETASGKVNTAKTVEVKSYGLVRVPAGEFEAFYLLSTSDLGARLAELWYAPKLRRHVKLVNYTSQGRTISELTNSSLIGSVPSSQAAVSPSSPPTPPPASATPPAPAPAPVTSSPPQKPTAGQGPWLGVPLGTPEAQALTEFGLPPGRGAVVVMFPRDPNLPRVDLEPGDIVVAIDGTQVEGPGHVSALLATRSPGSIVRVTVLRRSLSRQIDQPMVILEGSR